MQRLLTRLVFLVAGLLLLVSAALAQPDGDSAFLRFVHVIPGAAAVDVYMDGQLTVASLAYGGASNYIAVSAGTHTITVTQRGITTTLWQQEVNTAAGAALTLVASSTEPLAFQVYQDDLNPAPLGSARLTAVHAVAAAPPTVDVILTDERAMMPGLQYNQPYGTLDLPAAVYDIAVIPADDSIENAILAPVSLKLNSGASYMAVVYGTAVEASLLLLSAPTAPEADAGNVRFVQGTPGVAVDVYLNDTLVAPALDFDNPATEFIALPAGEYSLSVRASGETADLITDTVDVAAGDHLTLLVSGSEADAELLRFDDPVATISAEESVLSIINASGDASVSAFVADVEVLGSVAAGESDSAILEPSEEGLSAALEVGGESETFELQDVIYGGVYYTALAVDGEDGSLIVLLSPVSLAQSPDSAPGDQTIRVQPAAETTAETTAIAEVAEPTEAAVPEAIPEETTPEATQETTEVVPPASAGPTARVLVDPGANLHLRQFPSSSALSLGLAPSGAVLSVTGRQGAEELAPEETPEPEATEYVDPATLLTSPGEDLNPADTWLFVTFRPAEGGEIDAWVNALFLTVSDAAGRSQRLADLPTVPANRPGQTRQTTSDQAQPTATPIAADQVIATVQLNPGANLHLRRNPDAAAESLALIPSGAQVVVTGRTENGAWLQATYEGQQGWIAGEFVTLALNGVPYQSSLLNVISTPTPTPTPEGTAEAGA